MLRPRSVLNFLAWLWVALPPGAPQAQAEGLQSPDSISEAVRVFAEQTVAAGVDPTATVSVGTMDPRLRLPACSQPLDAFLPGSMQGRSNITVGVRCTGAAPWTLYVPVRITATRAVVVLTRPVARGVVLTAQDVDVQVRETASLGTGYYEDPGLAVGKVLTRNGTAGQVLSPTHLAGSVAVKRGQQVTLLANSGGVIVQMGGTALADGSVGERLRVKNNSSARIVEGVLLEDGSVEIGL